MYNGWRGVNVLGCNYVTCQNNNIYSSFAYGVEINDNTEISTYYPYLINSTFTNINVSGNTITTYPGFYQYPQTGFGNNTSLINSYVQ
jgi:hypothetical protein